MLRIRDKAINGAKWTTIERVVTLGLQFVIGIIVARLVSPADYGVIAMLSIFIAFGNVFINSGFNIALIRKKDVTQEDYSTALYFNVVAGLCIYCILYICAPYIADFYGISLLTDVTRVYTLTLPLGSLILVQVAKLTRELSFRLQFLINFISLIISGVIGIYMAFQGYGVWALVWQGLSSSIVRTILYWILTGWRPAFCFVWGSFKYLFSFGSKMLIINSIDTLYQNIYTLIIGKYYSATSLGYYNRSLQISQLPQSVFSDMISRVALPILAPYQDNNEKLLHVYGRMFKIIVFLLYPLMVLLMVLAQPTIFILLGEKWLPSAPYLQILSCSVIFFILTLINLNLLFVKGRSDVLLKIDVVKKIIGFAIVFIMAPLGLKWICAGTIIYSFFAFIINCTQTKEILNYGLVSQIKAASPALFYSVIMGVVVFLATQLVSSPMFKILIGLAVGMLSYTLLAYVMKDEALQEISSIFREKLHFKAQNLGNQTK